MRNKVKSHHAGQDTPSCKVDPRGFDPRSANHAPRPKRREIDATTTKRTWRNKQTDLSPGDSTATPIEAR